MKVALLKICRSYDFPKEHLKKKERLLITDFFLSQSVSTFQNYRDHLLFYKEKNIGNFSKMESQEMVCILTVAITSNVLDSKQFPP